MLCADWEYHLGLQTYQPIYFANAAKLFPLSRDRRSGLGYVEIMRHDPGGVAAVDYALRYDPHAADLWLGLATMNLNLGNAQGYNAAMTQLQKLTPGVQFAIVRH